MFRLKNSNESNSSCGDFNEFDEDFSDVDIFNKSDYIAKMESILYDGTKFKILAPASSNDSTSRLETRLQRRLLNIHKDDILPPNVYEANRPTGSVRTPMYGLSKTHKKDVPLRPILSMVGFSQHSLAKWLTSVLEPVFFSPCSFHCVSNSFTFVDRLRNSTLQS